MIATHRFPKEFIKHDGGDCPVDPESFVEPIIRTAEGLGTGGVVRANLHDWREQSHPDGIGAVVGYRVARRGDESHFDISERFKGRWG